MPEEQRSEQGTLMGVSMRRPILSRANVVALPKGNSISAKAPSRCVSIRTHSTRASRRRLGARWDPRPGKALPFEPRPPIEVVVTIHPIFAVA
jgi:hypothetical protein